MSDEDTPFSLAYLDWCKKRGIKNFEETKNRDLVCKFYCDEWAATGRPIDGFEFALATGAMG